MPIRSSALGEELLSRTVEVTPRMTLAFAAAVGDVGARTFDDAGALPLVAPPAFCARLEWGVLLPGRSAQFGLTDGERERAVHVEQDSAFHRPIQPGDRLTTRGRTVEIRATRAGALVRTRLSTTSEADGAPVVTSWHASIYRGVTVEGDGGRVEDPPTFPPPASDPSETRVIDIPREAAHVYSECADIWNPIHSERTVALRAGLPDVILHGTATWAIAGREIVARYAEGDPTRLKRLRAAFKSPVIPGHPVTLVFSPAAQGEVHFRVLNHEGALALADGVASIAP
jgi:acyl dehydratase